MYQNLQNNKMLFEIDQIGEKNDSPSKVEKDFEDDEPNIFSWTAPEHIKMNRSKSWYLYLALILAAIITYAIYNNSPVMAIIFILFGVMSYIFINKEPSLIEFRITKEGVIVKNELYEFEKVESFWIYYEPGEMKALTLHLKDTILPYVHLPLGNQDPIELKEVVSRYVPEEVEKVSFIDGFERFLGI